MCTQILTVVVSMSAGNVPPLPSVSLCFPNSLNACLCPRLLPPHCIPGSRCFPFSDATQLWAMAPQGMPALVLCPPPAVLFSLWNPVTLCAWLHRSKWLRLDAGCLAPYPAVPATRELIPLCHFILTWIQWRLDNRLQDSDFWNVEQDHSLGNNFLL